MKRNIVIAAVTAAALIGGGTATALATTGDGGGSAQQAGNTRLSDDDVRDDQDDRGDDDGRDDDTARAASGDVTAPEAIASALKHTPGTVVSAELDDEDDSDKVIWKVDVLSGDNAWHSVSVDPSSGKVLGAQTDDEDDTAQVRAALKGSSVTAEEAAKAAAGKGTVTSVDLDEDGKNKSWEAETHKSGGAEQDWKIDLTTGKVTADHSDAQDNDADDTDDQD
ncbi:MULTISPECIES: PepSY domain-containing protein [Streptomyces]|uniref:PepSY domain-containing protein n=1 Tax=Streptomyces koelreuteriae TaxID=2838015 RepID=A0ABX8FPC5_9ACTN|nr:MULTISPECIES: PepSY domain-containing protein [Streptomyces]QWB23038.1 PepSY domain-containing protein [Streptomyces koelreuteriae]UUA05988.1 PepSY domain-containing protein [Streptomyces koelreuteriae]UUA13616.1 PepSY domain-containing protein [Streptomyces sp. CRCS-T-1]